MLHFAPDDILRKKFSQRFSDYRAGDLFRADVDCNCMASDSFDAAFASHILEHVDDRKAMAELHRILKPGGKLIAMVPIIVAWKERYENPSITSRLLKKAFKWL
jgi:predicted SAM-dependent methyltransferase